MCMHSCGGGGGGGGREFPSPGPQTQHAAEQQEDYLIYIIIDSIYNIKALVGDKCLFGGGDRDRRN